MMGAPDRIHTLSAPARMLWAKTGESPESSESSESSESWLPLYAHMMDAACVAGLIWDGWLARYVPRTRGDDPNAVYDELVDDECSPHTRG